jgi:hypothetical protein
MVTGADVGARPGAPAAATPPAARGRVPRDLLADAGLWLAGRAALMGFVLLTAWVTGLELSTDRFSFWDAGHFLRIADVGYPPGTCCDQAFLPGYPIAVRAFSPVTGGDLVVAALVVSVLAGAVAAALLARLAARGADRATGRRALIYLMVAPYGIYFSVVYTESLFLMFALGAWSAAAGRRWWWAGLLAAAAVTVRVNGLFLVAALGVMYLQQLRADGDPWWRLRRDALAGLLPVAALGAVVLWLRHSTGSWNAWQEAETRGWDRHFAPPWRGLSIGWGEVTAAAPPHVTLAAAAAFATVVGGLALVVVLAVLRRWPEVVFIGLNVAVLVCSTTFVSSARYGLVWFPAFVLVAQLTGRPRWRWLHPVIVLACLPFLALTATLFSQHAWVS